MHVGRIWKNLHYFHENLLSVSEFFLFLRWPGNPRVIHQSDGALYERRPFKKYVDPLQTSSAMKITMDQLNVFSTTCVEPGQNHQKKNTNIK